MPIVVPAALFYADVLTDLGALQIFWESGQGQYLTLNLLFIGGSGVWGAWLASRVVKAPLARLLVAGLSVLQLLPAACLALAIILLPLSRMREECRGFRIGHAMYPHVSSRNLREALRSAFFVPDLLASTGLAESMGEALLGSEVQLYSYLDGSSWGAAEKAALRLSICFSLVSLTKAFAELDKQGKAIRMIQGVPTAAGACPMMHPTMVLVVRRTVKKGG
jgi:hypothetical protein